MNDEEFYTCRICGARYHYMDSVNFEDNVCPSCEDIILSDYYYNDDDEDGAELDEYEDLDDYDEF